MKRQVAFWEKILANHMSTEELYPEYRNTSQNLTQKTIKNPMFLERKKAKNLNRNFTVEDL
jgi:hypothetical protein